MAIHSDGDDDDDDAHDADICPATRLGFPKADIGDRVEAEAPQLRYSIGSLS